MVTEEIYPETWKWRDDVGIWWACMRTPKGNPVAGKWVKMPEGYLPIHGVDWSYVKEGSFREADRIAPTDESETGETWTMTHDRPDDYHVELRVSDHKSLGKFVNVPTGYLPVHGIKWRYAYTAEE